MKKYLYLLIISFSLVSCYTYKTKAEQDATSQLKKEVSEKSDEEVRKESAVSQARFSAVSAKNQRKPQTDKPQTTNQNPTRIEEKLESNKFYKIDVADRSYKIQVVKWESDTLVAHVIHKPKKILKFHKNQINQGTIAERRFSQRTADIITVVAYAAVGVGIWALVK